MTPEQDLIVGGKYRLEKPLARGGMGSVWVARHTELDTLVAVKFMARELVGTPVAETRFKREAKAAAQLKSPHVVSIHDYGVQDGAPYMVMELLEGEDLAALLDRQKSLSIARVAGVLNQVAKAIGIAHAAGIVHRDLKPSNLFLARSGDDEIVKVLDFGVAKETRSMLVDDRTTSGMLVGSPMYMSPEQARGESLDFRSDLWSLGVVVYEALAGRPPFISDHLGALLARIHEARFEPITGIAPRSLPPAIDAFMARALARQPEDRFQSAREMADALAAIGDDGRAAVAGISSGSRDVTAPLALAKTTPTAPVQAPEQSTIVMPRERDPLPVTDADPVSTTMAERPVPTLSGAAPAKRPFVMIAIVATVIGVFGVGWLSLTSREGAASGDAITGPASDSTGAATPTKTADSQIPTTIVEPAREPATSASALTTSAPATTTSASETRPSATSTPRATSSVAATAKPSASGTKPKPPPTTTPTGPAYDPNFGLPPR